jgi:hypothetical protein
MRSVLPLLLPVALLAQPGQAQDMSALPDPVPLLKSAEIAARLDGAIVTCLHGTTDPARAEAAFAAAGWTPDDADSEGAIGFEGPDVTVMFWDATEPGFCMIESGAIGTKALEARLTRVLGQGKWFAIDLIEQDGCPAVDLDFVNGVQIIATPSSAGNDPDCSAADSAALRFTAVRE